MRLVRNIAAAKGAATLLMLTVPFLKDLLACCCYAVPFSLDVMFDDVLARQYGFAVIISLVLYLVAFCFSQILMRAKHDLCMRIGLGCVIGTSLYDVICAVIAGASTLTVHIVINLLINITLLVLSVFEIRKIKREQ